MRNEMEPVSGGKKVIKTSTGLITVFAAAVIIFGGAYTYANVFLPQPDDSQNTIFSIPSTVSSNADQILDGYTKYSNEIYGFSFQYPTTWAGTKKEETTDVAQGILAKDLVYKITYYDPDMNAKIDCANNEYQNWKDATPTKTTCDPILSKLTAAQKEAFTGPRSADDVYLRVYKKPTGYSNLSSWLTSTFKKPNSELENYQVGEEITLGELKGYYSSIGCCAGVDKNYVVEKGDYIYSLGSSYFNTSIKDTDMPTTFQKIAPTFKLTTISVTADWKTYENTKYGYSFKYPKDWVAQDDKTGDIYLTNTKKEYVSEGSGMAPIVVQYFKDDYSASIETYLSGSRADQKSILKKETVTIGGKTAYVFQGILAPISHDSRLVFANGGVIIFSSNASELSGQDTAGAIGVVFNQILSTVSFTI